ncbi:MAG: 3-oxoadipate enol-lactonase [Litoreibacter sp.]
MPMLALDDVTLNYEVSGEGAPLVFANSLGTDMHLWDSVLPFLPQGLKIIRYDKRGHGRSSVPNAPYSMGALISDAERLLDHLQVKGCVFVGLSIGGIIAQGLAVKRLDLIRAMVLSNTAAKVGTVEMWQKRIDDIGATGLDAAADTVMQRWFSPAFCKSDAVKPWRKMLIETPLEGYLGCSAAIQGTDFYTTTASLTLPTLAIAGSDDGATPSDLVRETADLIKGSHFHLMRGAGHLPCAEKPEEYASLLTDFLQKIGHI